MINRRIAPFWRRAKSLRNASEIGEKGVEKEAAGKAGTSRAARARPTTGLHGAKRGVAIVLRVLRGGSWFDYQNFARSANRLRGYPEYRSPVIGFRVVCVADP